MYIPDTNTLICFFKGMGQVAERMFHEAPADIGVPAVVLFELHTGIARSTSPRKRASQLRVLVEAVRVLPFAAAEAQSAGKIRVQLENRGTPIGPYDLLIAGTALAAGGTLVTHNLAEFERIDGLRSEDWY